MQDRFKWRIFEYETKEMTELDAVGYSSFDPFAEGKSRLIMIPSGLGNSFHYDKQCLYDNDKFSEPMQRTGLKDKNGKLIYEGDILKAYFVNSDTGKTCFEYVPVGYDEEKLAFYTGKKFRALFAEGYFIPEEYEIVGNIYENPELLEDNE